MSHISSQPVDDELLSTSMIERGRRSGVRSLRVGLVLVAIIGAGVVAAACGGRPSPSVALRGASAGRIGSALAYVNCMHLHGEPNMPEPTSAGDIALDPSSGVDPSSPAFARANSACLHLIVEKGSRPAANATTPVDQRDYLHAVGCMRRHGFPDFPDPVIDGGQVSFFSRSPIDTSSAQYRPALSACEKLIPPGLPYSSRNGS